MAAVPTNETTPMTEIEQIQHQLTEVMGRIQHLEQAAENGKDAPRWQYLIARPHRWRRQLCIKGAIRRLANW